MHKFLVFSMIYLTNCASNQLTNPKTPFEITSATYEHWHGGVAGVSGTNIIIKYKSEKEIKFDSIFYNNQKAKVSIKANKTILGQFKKTRNLNNLSIDNTAAQNTNATPILNEATISYIEKNTIKYFKIKNLKQTESEIHNQ